MNDENQATDSEAFGRFVIAVAKLVDARGQTCPPGTDEVLLAAFRLGLSVEQTADLVVGGGARN